MRILFTTLAVPGHCFPLVPAAWALRAAGHDVRVATPEGGLGHVTASGLVACSTGPVPDAASYWAGMAAAPAPDVAHDRAAHTAARARRSATMFCDMGDRMVAPALEHCRDWRPDAVVFEPRCFAGPVVAEALGVPSVRHCWGPDSASMRLLADPGPMRELCAAHGIGWFADPDGRNPLSGTHTVEPAPKALRQDPLPAAWATRYVPFNGGAVLAPPPARRRPHVLVVGSGTFAAAGGHVAPVQAALDALAGTPVSVTVLLAPAGRALLTDVADDVTFLDRVPLEEVLPTADLIVHAGHGGPLMTAVAAGVPQLVFTGIADGAANGALLAASGAGLAADYRDLDSALVRAQVERILTEPSFAAAAAELRRQNDALPGPAELAARIAELA